MTRQVLEAGVNKIFTFPIFINSTGVTIQASATFQNKSTSSCKHCHVPIPFLPRRKISISSHPLSLAILLVLLSPWSVLLCSSSGFSMFPFRCGTQALALAGLGHYTTLKLLPLFLWTITLLFMETAFPFTFSFWGHLKLMSEIAIISCKIHLFLEYTARLYFPDYLKLYVAIECILATMECVQNRQVSDIKSLEKQVCSVMSLFSGFAKLMPEHKTPADKRTMWQKEHRSHSHWEDAWFRQSRISWLVWMTMSFFQMSWYSQFYYSSVCAYIISQLQYNCRISYF